jgi:hypothetical protein
VSRLAHAGTRLAIHGGLAGTLVLAGILAVATLSPGCGSSGGDGADGGDGSGSQCVPFNPVASAFGGFTSWSHQHLTTPFILAPDGGVDLVHTTSPRDIYINLGSPGQPACPPSGASEFPIGTIIVKVMSQAGQTVPGVFAQVKVGCGYNSGGADGWEWFDLITLQNGLSVGASGCPTQQSCTPEIVWQGTTPPSSQSYGGNPTECNVCHSLLGADNDSVVSSALSLKSLQCK